MIRLRIGGPAYRMQVRAEHAMCLANIVLHPELELERFAYAHSSLLPIGRAKILDEAIASDADVLLSMDSDVWMDDRVFARAFAIARSLFARVGAMSDPAAAALGVACPQDNGLPNFWLRPNERIIERPRDGELMIVHAIGAGIMFHNLAWHRRERARMLAAERELWPTVAYAVFPSGRARLDYFGEDYMFCESVNGRGGKIYALYNERGVFHAAAAT
jgi:hypothetical protein